MSRQIFSMARRRVCGCSVSKGGLPSGKMKAHVLCETPESILPEGRIDFSRLFMPEELAAFYHAPAYGTLSQAQRLRYNQLSALYFNEQTMFFETALARNVLGYFLAKPLPEDLKAGLRLFMAEE